MSTEKTNEFFQQEGLSYIECIDAAKLHAVINCDEALNHSSEWWNDINLKYQGFALKCEKEHLLMMLHECRKNEGEYILKTKYTSKENYGRVYPIGAKSLGSIRREVRHFLCKDIYWDIDIINCHFTIACGLCKKYNLSCNKLEEYVIHRHAKINQYKKKYDMDNVKKMFIVMLNGGSLTKFIDDNKGEKGEDKPDKFLTAFEKECGELRKQFIVLDSQQEKLYKELTAKKGTVDAKERTFIAKYLQIHEEQILRIFYTLADEKQLIEWGESRIVLCHDGCMLEKKLFEQKHIDIQEFINELNTLVENEVGYKCDFKVKEMNEGQGIQDILNKNKVKYNGEYIDEWVLKYGINRNQPIDNDDETLANLYYTNNTDKFVNCKNQLFKKNQYGMYQETTDKGLQQVYREHIQDFKEKYEKWNFHPIKEFGKLMAKRIYFEKDKIVQLKEFKKQITHASRCLHNSESKIARKLGNLSGEGNKIIKDLVVRFDDDTFEEKLDKNINLLGFNNGVIDFSEDVIKGPLDYIKVRKAKKGEYVSLTCGYDYYVNENVRAKAKILYKLFNTIFENPEVTRFVLKAFAKCLKGANNQEELAFFFLGTGSNGKGLFQMFVEIAMGGVNGYCQPINYTVLLLNKQTDNRSVELTSISKKRMTCLSEPPQSVTFNSEEFKKWTGKDTVTTRTNYAKKMTDFVPNTLFSQSNGKFNFDKVDKAVIRRICCVEHIYTFKKESDWRFWDVQQCLEFDLLVADKNDKNEKLMDWTDFGGQDPKDVIKHDDDMKRAMMYLLLQSYKEYKKEGLLQPDLVKKYTKDYVKSLCLDEEWFKTNLRREEENKGFNIKVSKLFGVYRKQTANYDITSNLFKQKLTRCGYELGVGKAIKLGEEVVNDSTRLSGNSISIVKNVIYKGEMDND